MKIKTAVIGCGKVGHFHANAYSKIEQSDFVACYGRTKEKVDSFAKEYGVKGYTDLRKMVDETGVEAVSICTPHPSHKEVAVECCKLGLHIAVEKPLAASLGDADEIISAAKEADIVGTTICQRRFFAPAKRVKQAIEDGKIGKPILGTVNMLGWRDMDYYNSDAWRGTWSGEGGGVLINQAPHQLDLLLWYMGEIDEVYGAWDTLNHPELEVDDTAVAVIRFKNGALGNIVVSNSQNPALFGNVRVHGYNGSSVGVQTDGGAMFIAGMTSIGEPPVNDIWTVKGEENMLDEYKKADIAFFNSVDSTYYYHIEQLKDYIDTIIAKKMKNPRLPLITLEDGRKTVELITAIYRSRRDNKPAKFPLFPEESDDFDGRLKEY